MFFESAVIVLIILVVSAGFMRQRKKVYAKATIPIVIVPLFNILVIAFSDMIGKNILVTWGPAVIVGYFVCFLLSMVIISFNVKKFSSKRRQKVYLITVGIFLFLLLYVFAKANVLI